MEKIPQLPKKLSDYNYMTRLRNFDKEKFNGYHDLIVIDKEDDLKNQYYKLWCIPRDVFEDSTSLFTTGKAGKIKKTVIHEVVNINNYIMFGKGELSNAFDVAWSLPPSSERLPSGIIKNFPNFISFIENRGKETTIIRSQKKRIEAQEEELMKIDKGINPEQLSSILKITRQRYPSSSSNGENENNNG